jgi:hypothetical protein
MRMFLIVVLTMMGGSVAQAQYADPQAAVSGLLRRDMQDPHWADREAQAILDRMERENVRRAQEHPELYGSPSSGQTCVVMGLGYGDAAVDCR